jgi:hypothetical protein
MKIDTHDSIHAVSNGQAECSCCYILNKENVCLPCSSPSMVSLIYYEHDSSLLGDVLLTPHSYLYEDLKSNEVMDEILRVQNRHKEDSKGRDK